MPKIEGSEESEALCEICEEPLDEFGLCKNPDCEAYDGSEDEDEDVDFEDEDEEPEVP